MSTTLPATMRAMLLTGFGNTDKLVLRTDLPLPVPGPDQVLLKVGACGVNNTDVWTREGAYGASEQSGWAGGAFSFPRIQGADMVGRIVAAGSAVPPARLGQRVMVNPTVYAADGDGLFEATYIGSEWDGGFAEYACVPAVNAHPIDCALSDAELATFMTSYLTGHHMLNRAQLAAGETVLVTGASGGVGSALVQLAQARGAQVVAIVGRGKEGPLAGLGVSRFLYRDEPDPAGALRLKWPDLRIDVIADIVAGAQLPAWLDMLRVGGRYVTAGAIGGPMVTLDWRRLYLRHLTLLGATMGTQDEARELVGLVAGGRLRPLLHASYPLEQLAQAQTDFKQRHHFGKLVILP